MEKLVGWWYNKEKSISVSVTLIALICAVNGQIVRQTGPSIRVPPTPPGRVQPIATPVPPRVQPPRTQPPTGPIRQQPREDNPCEQLPRGTGALTRKTHLRKALEIIFTRWKIFSGFVNDYSGCANYFSCIDYTPFEVSCPAPFHFDAVRLVCDLPTHVRCSICPATGIVGVSLTLQICLKLEAELFEIRDD